jgi:protein-tyrosine-phosphatase
MALMSRITHSLLLAGLLLCFGSGCAHFIEAQTIDHFTVALQKKDLPSLKSSTSETFERKTLRLAESLDDFKIINLPQGKTSIVKVEDVTEDEKRVTVEVGESKRKLLYKLTHDRETQKWVVDDIYVKQKKKGMTSARSVTEQMDLLLTVREFLAAWDQGDRNQALSVTTPEFGQLLSELPPAYFARLARQVVGEKSRTSAFRPEAELDADVAIVQLPRSNGRMVLTFKLLDEAWKVSDIAVEAGGEGKDIPSVLKMATALQASLSFLEAYHAADNRTLAKVCTKKFYRSSLAYADLTTVELPRVHQIQNEYKVKMRGVRADFVVSGESEIVRLTLKRSNLDSDSTAMPNYLVEDVTIFELESTQEKRLSSLFTAHAVMQIFSDALAKRDLNRLRKTSTADFNRRIWKKIDDSILTELPLSEIERNYRDAGTTRANLRASRPSRSGSG